MKTKELGPMGPLGPMTKRRWPASVARPVAEELRETLARYCVADRCVVAGSLRRGKAEVGDIEILFVPRVELRPSAADLFGLPTDLAARAIDDLCCVKWLRPRENKLRRTSWGELIKLAEHVTTGIPVDFFTATAENWWNYLVCRTGPKESNMAICKAAQARGWKWEPYSSGFVQVGHPEWRAAMHSEREVFEFVRLPYREPEKR